MGRTLVSFLAVLVLVLLVGGTAGAQADLSQLGVPPRVLPPNAAELAADGSPEQEASGAILVMELQRVLGGALTSVRDDFNAIRANVRRLGGLARVDPDEARALFRALARPALAALAVGLIGGVALRPLSRRIGAASADRGMIARAGFVILQICLDLALVAGATLAGGLSLRSVLEHEDQPVIALLGTILVAGVIITAVRAIFNPALRELRLVPASDATARYWTWRLSIVIALVVTGEILVPVALPLITTPLTTRSVTIAFYAVAILFLMWLVIANRRAPRQHFERVAAESEGDFWTALLALLSGYWHIPVLMFLAALLHLVMTRGVSAVPVLGAVAEVLAALALAGLVITVLEGVAARGIRFSDQARRGLPGVEERLNAFLYPFVRIMRFLLGALWLLVVLRALGIHALDWIEARFGVDIIGSTISAVVIVVIVAMIWIALDAIVDYRLTPRPNHAPSAREQTVLTLARNAAFVVLLLFGFYYVLLEIGISLAPLLASAGVIALAISWGSQRLVQDVITGLFMQLENAINVGDVVEADGKLGVVEKLTVRSVSLRDIEGVYHLIPFSAVDCVSNHSKGFTARRIMMDAYDEMAGQFEWRDRLIGGVEWFGVQMISDSAVVLRARLKTTPGDQWAVGRAYTELVKRRFDAAGIEIPYPQMRLWAPGPPHPSGDIAGHPTRQTRAPGSPTDADSAGDGSSDAR